MDRGWIATVLAAVGLSMAPTGLIGAGPNYSPVAVLFNQQFAVGVSLIYSLPESKHWVGFRYSNYDCMQDLLGHLRIEVDLYALRDQGMTLGMWWGRAGQVSGGWNTGSMWVLDPNDPKDIELRSDGSCACCQGTDPAFCDS